MKQGGTVRRLILLAAVLLVLLPGGRGLAQTTSPLPGEVPRFEPAPCPLPAPAEVSCGYLVVPENRNRENDRTIRLAVAIVPAQDENPAPDPVVFMTGGPGASTLPGVNGWQGHPARLHRDVILLEQRGTDYSEPWLACPEVDAVLLENMSLALSGEEEVAREVEAAAACRDRLEAQGIDLSAYNSAASAADLEDLRLTLGYEQWNLLGVSYGTRLALTVLRDYPDGVRSVVLNSPFPIDVDTYVELVPNARSAFHALFADCQADPACNDAYPDLEARFYRALEETNRNPIEVSIPIEPYDVKLTAKDLIAGMFTSLGSTRINALLPFLIDQIDRRNADVLAPMVENGLPGLLGFTRGMMQSVECYEEAPFNPPEAIQAAAQVEPVLLDYLPIHFDLATCAVWPSGQAGPIEDQPVYSDVPVLLLAGEYDPYTPPSWARQAAETLSQAYLYEFPGLGHGPLAYSICARQIAADFWADPTTEPDASCIAEMLAPDFLLASDLYLTPAVYRLNTDLYTAPRPLLLGLAGAGLLGLAAGLLAAPIAWLRRRRRPAPGDPPPVRLARGLAAVAAVSYLAFVIALWRVIQTTSAADWLTLGFGLPARLGWIFWLPRLGAVSTAGLALCVLWAWLTREGALAWRLAYSLLAAAAVALSLLMIHWRMLTWPF